MIETDETIIGKNEKRTNVPRLPILFNMPML